MTSSSGRRSGVSKTCIDWIEMCRNIVPCGGSSSARIVSKGGMIWPEVAMIPVVLMADDHQVRGLVDRLVSPAIGRAIGIENDPNALGLDQECRMAEPGDPHEDARSEGVDPLGTGRPATDTRS